MSNPVASQQVHIVEMTLEWAAILAPQIAQSDPWKQLGIQTTSIETLLGVPKPDHIQRAIVVDGAPVGAMVIHTDWLAGPYLRHLSILQSSQGSGMGAIAVDWLFAHARAERQRNVWLCVSQFNARAEKFYRRLGFEPVITIDDLIVAGENELLMRRRLIV